MYFCNEENGYLPHQNKWQHVTCVMHQWKKEASCDYSFYIENIMQILCSTSQLTYKSRALSNESLGFLFSTFGWDQTNYLSAMFLLTSDKSQKKKTLRDSWSWGFQLWGNISHVALRKEGWWNTDANITMVMRIGFGPCRCTWAFHVKTTLGWGKWITLVFVLCVVWRTVLCHMDLSPMNYRFVIMK